MKIRIDQYGTYNSPNSTIIETDIADVEISAVWQGLTLVTEEGHKYGICMRDETIVIEHNETAPSPKVIKFSLENLSHPVPFKEDQGNFDTEAAFKALEETVINSTPLTQRYQIPDHLLRRAEQAKSRTNTNHSDSKIPAHLLKRAEEAKKRS